MFGPQIPKDLQYLCSGRTIHRVPLTVSETHNAASIDDEVAAELVWVALDRPQSFTRGELPEVVPHHPRCPRAGKRSLQPVRAIDSTLRIEQERKPNTGLLKPDAGPPLLSE